jgi:hypothetical protein
MRNVLVVLALVGTVAVAQPAAAGLPAAVEVVAGDRGAGHEDRAPVTRARWRPLPRASAAALHMTLEAPSPASTGQTPDGHGLTSYRLLNGFSSGTRRTLLKPASAHNSRTFGSWRPTVPSPTPPLAREVVMQ